MEQRSRIYIVPPRYVHRRSGHLIATRDDVRTTTGFENQNRGFPVQKIRGPIRVREFVGLCNKGNVKGHELGSDH